MSNSLLPLTGSDLGRPTLTGSTQPTADGYDLTAGGSDIWMKADEGHYAWRSQTGDFELQARITAFAATHLYAKAGLMARESLNPGSRHVYFLAFHGNATRNHNEGGFEGHYRTETDGKTTAIYPAKQPDTIPPQYPVSFPNAWLRLGRRGDRFEFSLSSDGRQWTVFAQHALALPSRLFVGLAVTSHDPASLAKASFREIGLR